MENKTMEELVKELKEKLEIGFGYQIGKEVILSVHQVDKQNFGCEIDIDGIFQYINYFIEQNFVSKTIHESQLSELKAENEKLSDKNAQLICSMYSIENTQEALIKMAELEGILKHKIDINDLITQARKDEKDTIIEMIERYGRENMLRTHCQSIIEKIEPNLSQNTENCLRNEPSCEGCANNGQVLKCYHCDYNNHYQPKEKINEN